MKFCFIEIEALLRKSILTQFHIVVHASSQIMEIWLRMLMNQGTNYIISYQNEQIVRIQGVEKSIKSSSIPFFEDVVSLAYTVYDSLDNEEVFHVAQPIIILANDNEIPTISFYCEEYNCVKAKRITKICIPVSNVEIGFSGNPQLQM